MEIKQLVETIVREIVGQMAGDAKTALTVAAAKPPKVLYVFGDSTAHEAYTDHFIELRNRGVAHDLLFLDGETSAWLGKHRIESGGPGKVIAVDEFAPAPLEVPQDYDGIVIPEIDLDNMGRATLGIRGTVLSDLLFSALVTEKFVLIGEDGSGLKRADRRTLRTIKLPKPFQNLFDYYKQELSMYGASFGPREKLAGMAADLCGRDARNVPTSGADDAAEAGSGIGADVRFEGKLVTADWVAKTWKLQPFSMLTIGKHALLSPLAKDVLKEKGISVRRADG